MPTFRIDDRVTYTIENQSFHGLAIMGITEAKDGSVTYTCYDPTTCGLLNIKECDLSKEELMSLNFAPISIHINININAK